MNLSVVNPARNEADNIIGLVEAIDRAMEGFAPFETIVVDDGSTDDQVARPVGRAAGMPHLRVIRHDWSGGQSAKVLSGLRAVLMMTLDGGGQNPPEELPKLAAPLLADTPGDALWLIRAEKRGL